MLPNERTTRNEVAATPGEVEGLIVAPDRAAARPLLEFLRAEGVNVQVVTSADHAFEEALLHRPNVLVIDERISHAGGVDLCERLKANRRTHFLPVILVSSAKQDELLRLDALAAGADALFSPGTSKEERRARLWALLRSQAIFRRLDSKSQAQHNAMSAKRRWVRGLIHDIQNSLGAIQANFEYIAQQLDVRRGNQGSDLEECVDETRATFREMVRNLRTVLEFERFEAGDIALKRGKVLLSELAQAVRSSLEPLASSMHKSIVVDTTSSGSPIQGDENYLREAIASLSTFVLRQSENQVCTLQASSDGGFAYLRIHGDKYQIPTAIRQRIFDPYSASGKDRPAQSAHKVGLALAKVIVEMQHGSIWVEDTLHAGSTFVIELPSNWPARGQRSPE